jgi:hypothetical protein
MATCSSARPAEITVSVPGHHRDVQVEEAVRRSAENQSRFRDVNEQIELAADRMHLLGPVPFVCECPRLACSELVSLSLESYEEIRQYPRRFFTIVGHQDGALAHGAGVIVHEAPDHVVVDQIGEAGRIAEERHCGGDPPAA